VIARSFRIEETTGVGKRIVGDVEDAEDEGSHLSQPLPQLLGP
jgi:hypothetical protein